MSRSLDISSYNLSGFINSSKENQPCYLNDDFVSRTLKISALFFFGGFGILSNTFIIVLAMKYTRRKNLHHLIINMAVADALVILVTFGLEVPPLFDKKIWADFKISSGNIICQSLGYFLAFSMCMSYITLLLISIQRFKATRSIVQIRPLTVRQRFLEIACSWLIAMTLGAHEIPYRTIEHRGYGIYGCEIFKIPISLDMCIYVILVVTFVCIIILSTVSLRMILQPSSIEANLTEQQRKKRAKRSANCVKMVFFSLLLYSLSYVPFVIWNLFKAIANDKHEHMLYYCLDLYVVDYLIALLPLVNSCFSPGIYLIFLKDFRKAAKRILCRGCVGQINNLRGNFEVRQMKRTEQISMSYCGKRETCQTVTTAF